MLDLLGNEVQPHTHFFKAQRRRQCVESDEGAMTRAFWKEIQHYMQLGKLSKGQIVGVENNPRSRIAGGLSKQRGVVSGFSDYLITRPRICFLEAKIYKHGKPRKDGTMPITKTKLTQDQNEFIQTVARPMSTPYEVFRTPAEGFYWLKQWGVVE